MTRTETAAGIPFDPERLDAVERRFWADIWDGAAAAAPGRGIEARAFGPVQATLVTALPQAQMLNLVLGAGEDGAVNGGHLAAALDWVDSLGVSPYVPLTPSAPGAGAGEELLRERGYLPGYAWMKFVRDAHEPRFAAPAGVEVTELGDGEHGAFGMIAAAGFGLPAWASAFFADLPGRPGWRCYLARVDEVEAGCAAMFVDGDVAEFGIAATLEPARGRGCQLALLRRRIADAAAVGCRTLFVETGERTAERPSGSYRNILRAGFEEAYLRPNWLRKTS